MTKLMFAPLAALLMVGLAFTASAQDKTKQPTPDKEARKVSLVTKFVKDIAATEVKVESTEKIVDIAAGTAFDKAWEEESATKVIEFLEVDEAGKLTKARIKWTAYEGNETTQKPGAAEPSLPVAKESGKLNASILYTWNAETKKYDSKLEEGKADNEEVKEELEETDPFANPFIPEKEVSVGDEWNPDEAKLKEFFSNKGMDLSEVKGTCKAAEIGKGDDGVEYLGVTFEVTLKGKMVNEELSNPEFEAKITGVYAWDIANGRVAAVEMANELAFSANVKSQMGPVDIKFNMTGAATMGTTYAAIEKKDGK